MLPAAQKILRALAEYSPFDRLNLPQVRKPGPFEVGLALLLLVSGLLFFAGQNIPTSVELLAPKWLQYLWYALLAGGGLVTLVGILWPSRFTGLLVEQAGLLFMAGGSLIYAFSIAYVFHWQGYFGVSSWVVFTISELWRWNQIRVDLKRYKRLSTQSLTARLVITPREQK